MHSDHLVARCVAAFTVTIVLGIFVAEWFAYHFYTKPPPLWVAVFNATWFLAVWSYVQTVFTNPGTPSSPEWQDWAKARQGNRSIEQWRKDAEEEAAAEPHMPRTWSPGKPSWCRTCRAEKPERAHHCSSCGCCILRMDHHCPWIGTCVGWRNHKYFLLLNWWCFWACVCFVTSMTRPTMLDAVSMAPGNLSLDSLLLMLAILGILIFTLLTGILFIVSMWAAMRNGTTVEDYYVGDNPYCLPTYMENLTQLLGHPGLRWLVPVPCSCRPSDGTSFLLKAAADSAPASYGSV
mmetsp:Transcript_42917/g.80064  ORF Transcript_42917/g.80064 Transcript_42917/m.80064 type:complete len:292 (-) Transcript_42917:50-925(-)